MLFFLVILVALVLLDIAALSFGVDSRDGGDWRATDIHRLR